jgi:uncharacterized protein (UPF0210 family)
MALVLSAWPVPGAGDPPKPKVRDSAVCAGGVDTVPLAGDTSEDAIARIAGDVATLAFRWNKPLAARLLPAPGKKAGDLTEFSGALANAVIQPLIGTPRRTR